MVHVHVYNNIYLLEEFLKEVQSNVAGLGTQLPFSKHIAFITLELLLHRKVTLAFSKVLEYSLIMPFNGGSGCPQSTTSKILVNMDISVVNTCDHKDKVVNLNR